MDKRFVIVLGVGCGVLILLLLVAIPVAFLIPARVSRFVQVTQSPLPAAPTPNPQLIETQQAVPTFTPGLAEITPGQAAPTPAAQNLLPLQPNALIELYHQVNPGVVNIQVYLQRQGVTGQGAGSGFIIDDQGHIVTNNHVVDQAQQVTVIFYNGIEAPAKIIGTDPDSDLAVIQVDTLAGDAHPLALGDSDQAQVGQWVVAIGNPFGLGSSLTTGILSALGRTIPTGVTPFSIPQALQTDAAINPGNSGGPLINLEGQVIGVNAQIATSGTQANSGVGFSIPVNIVRRVVPVLIRTGSYEWPWLGVEGGSVNLLIQQANDLPTQQGAYIDRVVPGGPADKAGLRGSSSSTQINGLDVPVGGDVVVEADGEQILDFSDLLVHTAFQEVGASMHLSILRAGQRQEVTVQLSPRPANFGQ
jgi:S1-C subfamily serine protease